MKYHEQIPRDVAGNVEWRKFLLGECRKYGGKFRRWAKEACRRDGLFYINSFVWQFNPKAFGDWSLELGPFVTPKFQDEAFLKINDHIERGRDLLLEKSRDMGASWLCLLALEYRARFIRRQKFLALSRNETLVDDVEEPDSLFWKLDFIHRYLPEWLCGPIKKGSANKGHSAEPGVRRRRLSLYFEETDSYITGEATTSKAGVGGRATAIFLDEYSQMDQARAILHRTSDTTSCRIFNGTHLGVGTVFAELCDPRSAIGAYIDKLQLHWSLHPDKRRGLYKSSSPVQVLDPTYQFPADYQFVTDGSPAGGPYPGIRSPWYDDQCRRKGSRRAVAMDLDMNPQGAQAEFFDAMLIQDLIRKCEDPCWTGDIRYDRATGENPQLIVTPGGALKMWVYPNYKGGIAPGTYVIGSDLSVGSGSTPSCATVLKARGDGAGKKVAEYVHAWKRPEDFAEICAALGWLFRSPEGTPAKLGWEMQGPGVQYSARLEDMGYPNVYYRVDEFDREKRVSRKAGWYPDPKSKLLVMGEYRAALQNGHFENLSEPALRECLNFEYSGNTVKHGFEDSDDPSSAKVNHGDRAWADAIAWMLAKLAGWEPEEQRVLDEPLVGTLAHRRSLAAVSARNETNGW